MKKDLTELVFILDRSGSMGGLELETIQGYNNMLKKQKNGKGEVIVTTVLFDHLVEILHKRVNLNQIKPITHDDYFVRGSTALLDAVGQSISYTVNIHKSLSKEERPEKTLFVITTDGFENASKEYTYSKVKRLINIQKERYKWEFIFLGANIDAIETSKQFGINANMAANFHADKEGTNLNYEVISDAITEFRVKKSMNTNWKKKIEDDFTNRK
ncbi:MAG: vWA domain-containing protein [Candidatus Izemoplasmataceae bacterium]